MTTERRPRRHRPHAALGARIVAAGLSGAASLAMMSAMAGVDGSAGEPAQDGGSTVFASTGASVGAQQVAGAPAVRASTASPTTTSKGS